MGIMSIRKTAQKILAPVIVVLVVAMGIGLFYMGPSFAGKSDGSYQGPSIRLNGVTLKDSDFEKYLSQASQQAQQYAQYGMTITDDQVLDMAASLAINDMAFQEQMKKAEGTKAGSKIKVSSADAEKFIEKRWPTEEEQQSAMQQFGFFEKGEFNQFVAENLEKLKFVSYKGRQLKITVSKDDVEKALKQITVSHILIGLKDSSTNKDLRTDSQALQLAQQVYQKASGGANFTDLAKQYSDDPGSKEKGGSLGQMPLSQFESGMVKEFVAAALALKEGQISQPVKTQYGYHIIKLDSLTMDQSKYKETEDQLLTQQTQQSPKFEKWLTNIYKVANQKAEILDPGIRAYRFKQKQQWAEAATAYEKALKKSYYNTHQDTYLNLSDVYLKLNRAKDAIAILKKVPAEFRTGVDCQLAFAKAYQADGQSAKALSITKKISKANPDELTVHQKLQGLYNEWKLSDYVTKEEQIIAGIQKKAKDAAAQQQQQQQPTTTPQTQK